MTVKSYCVIVVLVAFLSGCIAERASETMVIKSQAYQLFIAIQMASRENDNHSPPHLEDVPIAPRFLYVTDRESGIKCKWVYYGNTRIGGAPQRILESPFLTDGKRVVCYSNGDVVME